MKNRITKVQPSSVSPIVKPIVSRSTFYQGDCLVEMDKIADKSIDMILCDLPYGTTACKWDSIIPFAKLWEHYERIIKYNGTIVLFGAEPFSSALRMSNIKNYKYDWIWEKNPTGFLNAKKMPMKNFENICIFYEKLPTYNAQGLISINKILNNHNGERISTHNGGRLKGVYTQDFTNYPKQILNFKNDKGLHPTQKPVALMEYLIKTYTNEGETVLDNCMGSGTTGCAAKKTGRHFIGIEKDEKYFEIAVSRVSAYCG